ncbi:MAG: recombinase family protein [Actinobacteria bacterium]|nr:recombinase family protein [Actinomycetota bacterium]
MEEHGYSGLPVVPYIRVSRVGGRDKTDGYISPKEQQKAIDRYAEYENVELHAPIIEENVSGGSLEGRSGFEQAMTMVDRGTAGGVISLRLNRIARNIRDAIDIADRLDKKNARLISVSEKIDLGTGTGRFQFYVFAALAQLELEQITEQWKVSVGQAVEKGIHISAAVPFGYLKGEDRRLYPDPEAAPSVKEIFKRRAKSPPESWAAISAWLWEQGVKTGRGNEGFSRSALQAIVTNRAYLGEAHYVGKGKRGKEPVFDLVNPKAHKPLVSATVFERAQPNGETAERNGTLTDQTLLRGILTCEFCGHRLVLLGSTDRATGERMANYHCARDHADGKCSQPVAIQARRIDPVVEELFLDRLSAYSKKPRAMRVTNTALLVKAEAKLAEEEAGLASWLAQDFIGIPQKLVEKQKAERLARFSAAEEALKIERDRAQVGAEIEKGDLVERWPELGREERNRILRAAIDRVVITDAGGKRGRGAPPPEKRIKSIAWATGIVG